MRVLYNTWLYRQPKKKFKKKKPKKRKGISRIQRYANELNKNLPKSEIWFHQYYSIFRDKYDKNNSPISNFIPDVLNTVYKYVIEIDGSYHDRLDQKEKDVRKDFILNKRGYRVFRIKAYDDSQLVSVLNELIEYRDSRKA